MQGVGYRFFAQRAAAQHQVVGYVRNMPDGSVESLAEGSAGNVEAFRNDLVTGPQWSSVTQVEEIGSRTLRICILLLGLKDKFEL